MRPLLSPHHRQSRTAAKAAPQPRPPSGIKQRGNDFDDFVSVDLKNCGGGASWGGRSGGIPHVIPPDRPPQEIPSIQRTYARAHDPLTRRLEASPHDNAGLPPMHHDDRMWVWREASACLPCAVQCTTMIECMPLHMAQSNGTTTIECGCGERDCFDAGPRIPTPPRGRFPPPPRGCTPSSPVFYPAAKTAISF